MNNRLAQVFTAIIMLALFCQQAFAAGHTVSITSTNVSCNSGCDGTAAASVTGGTGPFGYSWTPGNDVTANISSLCAGTYTCSVTDSSDMSVSTATVLITQPTPLSAAVSSGPVSCFGGNNGSAAVSVSGGTSPYTFVWNPTSQTTSTITNLPSGVYSVMVTDNNGCTATQSVTVTEPPQLTVNVTVNNHVTCFGGSNGSATVTASGGVPGYTYTWSPSGGSSPTASGLVPGTYFITVTDVNGCTSNQAVTITQPTQLTATVSSNNVSCNGGNNGSATVIPSGGTPGYTFSWMPSGGTGSTASGLAAGNYTVNITDANGCLITRTVTINQPTQLIINAGNDVAICQGGSVGLNSFGGGGTSPFNYSWAPGSSLSNPGVPNPIASPQISTTYSVVLTDANGCTAVDAVTVFVAQQLTITTSTNPATCNMANGSATANVSGGNSPYTYSWVPNGATTAAATNLPAGNYTVTVTDASGCATTALAVVPSQPIALSVSTVSASCNQSNGSATVSATTGTAPFTYSWNTSPVQTSATASNLAAGSYTATVTDANNCSSTIGAFVGNTNGPSLSVSSMPVSCNGGSNGSAIVSASGGTPPYTYSWSSGGTAATESNLSAGTYMVTVTDNNNCISIASVTVTQPTSLATSVSTTAPTCNNGCDGSVNVAITGGTAPYSILWSTGQTTSAINSLCAGTYSVTVTDFNGCTSSSSASLTNPPPFLPNAGPDVTICAGSTIQLNGTGGIAYTWTPGTYLSCSNCANPVASPPSTMSYTLTAVNASGCSGSDLVTIYVNQGPVIDSTSATPATCNQSNGGISVTISGGTPPYTYLWSPAVSTSSTASNLSAGTYTVTVNDANNLCSASTIIAITNSNAPVISLSSTGACNTGNNGTATVMVTGGTPPYSYAWSTNPAQSGVTASNLSAGGYTVTVTDAQGCMVTGSTVVANTGNLFTSVSALPANCNNNGSATINVYGGTQPYTYAWNINPPQTSQTATGLLPGTHQFTVTDAVGCTRTASAYIWSYCKSVIKGRVFNDANGNCIQDAGENAISNRSVRARSSTNLNYYGFTNSLGDYTILVPGTGPYTVSVPVSQNYWYTVCPAAPGNLTVSFAALGDTSLNNNFGMQFNANAQDVGILCTWTGGSPGYNKNYRMYYYNRGADTVNATLQFVHDSNLVFVSSNPPATNYSPSQRLVEYNVPNLVPDGGTISYSRSFFMTFSVPPPPQVTLSTMIESHFLILPVTGDAYPIDNALDTYEPVTGSYDPNMKEVTPSGTGPQGFITAQDSMLNYIVHFQNTGNDTAFKVVIVDTLSPYVDPATFESGGSSHPYTVELSGEGVITWTFDNILLVDSTTNEPGSHGHIHYRIRQVPGNPPGTVISNKADIYFDFNSPITTNTVVNTIATPTAIAQLSQQQNVTVYPNPFNDEVMIMVKNAGTDLLSLDVYNTLGEKVYYDQSMSGHFSMKRNGLGGGIYLYRVTSSKGIVATGKLIAE
jgi:hypothetical protein